MMKPKCLSGESVVPVISMFYGIVVSMYFIDDRRHHLPHIHVRYQDSEAVFSIQDGQILGGNSAAGEGEARSGVD
jgi:hypothetical protein